MGWPSLWRELFPVPASYCFSGRVQAPAITLSLNVEVNRMNRFCRVVFFGLMGAVVFTPRAAMVHAQATNSSDSAQKKIELLPGLDKQLIDTGADPCVNFY